jgi:hypothetical protein
MTDLNFIYVKILSVQQIHVSSGVDKLATSRRAL